jgi:putative sigma-54 modulation protein
MQLNIQAFNTRPKEELMSSIRDKFIKLEKFYDRIHYCEVTIDKEKNSEQKNCIIEAKLDMPRKTLFAREKAETFKLALGQVIDSLKEQITTYKEQLQEVR